MNTFLSGYDFSSCLILILPILLDQRVRGLSTACANQLGDLQESIFNLAEQKGQNQANEAIYAIISVQQDSMDQIRQRLLLNHIP